MENNTFLDSLKRNTNYTKTENGAIAHKSTLNAVYDLFALGGAYRNRSDEDCILLFKKAFEEDNLLALKCLFYLRSINGGQGERRFFRVCYNWLSKEYPDIALKNLKCIPNYGRWDDLYSLVDTPLEKDVFNFFGEQLDKDLMSLEKNPNMGVSLLGKWLKSENASSKETKRLADKTRKALKYSHKDYRKILSALRTRINIVEKLMSENRWEEIEFDKIPSRAGLIYRNAFAHKDIISDKYANFINSKNTKVNAKTLYPYDIVKGVTDKIEDYGWGFSKTSSILLDKVERETLNKYWENQNDYLNGKSCKMMCIVDTSRSMLSSNINSRIAPIDVAISLGIYCAERVEGPFKNYYISFSSHPQLVKVEGIDFCDKVHRIYKNSIVENTNLRAAFDLLKDIILRDNVKQEDIPEQLVVISDMEIDAGSCWRDEYRRKTEMEEIKEEWTRANLKMPKLVYWNVNARNNIILEDSNNDDVTFVSGCSPIIFKSVIEGKSGIQLMLDILNSEKYASIK